MTKALAVSHTLLPERKLTKKDLVDGKISTLERATFLRIPEALRVAEALKEIGGRPLADRILVYPLPPDAKYGDIIIPEVAQEDQICGIVVGVGRGKSQNGIIVTPEVREGNFVMFSKHSHRKLRIGSLEVFQIVEADITFTAGK